MTPLEKIPFESPAQGYAPREDSWLLARTIEANQKIISGKKCLDMGCGSGIQTAALLVSGAKIVTCVDVNKDALHTTKKMIEKNFTNANVLYVESNLFEKIKLSETFDIIAFNPPYVPSEKIKWVEVDGGKKGREIIDAFLKELSKHLSKEGVCFLLQSSLNGTQTTQNKLKQKSLTGKIVSHEKLAFETLSVWKIHRI